MNQSEFLNELGNLYFLNGAYEPAIHAYLRAIEQDSKFGRSYSNLGLALSRTGRNDDAVRLYLRSIVLLSDEREKLVTWRRLGTLYSQIKEYDLAVEAYREADLLASGNMDHDTVLNLNVPLSTPAMILDIESLVEGNYAPSPSPELDLLDEINSKLEMAEEQFNFSWLIPEMVPPYPLEPLKANDTGTKSYPSEQGDWRFEYRNETTSIKMFQQEQDDIAFKAEELPEHQSDMEVEEFQETAVTDLPPVDIMNSLEEPLPVFEAEATQEETSEPLELSASIEDEPAEAILDSEVNAQSELLEDNSSTTPFIDAGDATEAIPEPVQYVQVEYSLTDLPAEERYSLEDNVTRYKQAVEKNQRSYNAWESLGDAYKAAGMYKDAVKAFQTAISLNSNKPSYYYKLGLIYAAERKEPEAIMAFKKVLEMDANYAKAHASLASHYRKMGLEDLAQTHIEKALNMNMQEETDYNKACLEAICGNNENALDLLETALRSKQTTVYWVQKDPDFDGLHTNRRFQELLAAFAPNASAKKETVLR